MKLIDSVVNNNTAYAYGGGIVVSSAILKLEDNVQIKGNTVTAGLHGATKAENESVAIDGKGGGIMLLNPGSLLHFVGQEGTDKIVDISDNRAFFGGGIYSQGAFIFLASPGKYPENNHAYYGNNIYVKDASKLICFKLNLLFLV